MLNRILNILIALDQFLFCIITLGRSSPDETMSSAAWRLEQEGRWQGKLFRPIIDTIFRPIEKNHCQSAFYSEYHGRHLPRSLRRDN